MPLLAAALLLAAASTPAATAPAPLSRPQAVSACTAATRLEVERAVGASIDVGKLRQDAGGSTCDYTGEAGQITIALHHSVAALDFNAEIASLKAALQFNRKPVMIQITRSAKGPRASIMLVRWNGS